MKKHSLLFIGLVLAVLAVCIAGTVIATSQEAQNTTTTLNPELTIAVGQTTAEIAAGDSVKFIIPANPTTGYNWVVTNADGLKVTEEFIAPETNLAGAGGQQVFILSAEKAGTYTFTAEYKRPWDSGTAPLSTFTQMIVVKEATESGTAEEPVYVVSFDGTMNPQAHEVVKITVPGNPTTGYDWNLTQIGGLNVLKAEYLPDGHEEGMVGVGGSYVWYVTANTAGTYTFGAEYKRSWEDGAVDQFALSLIFT